MSDLERVISYGSGCCNGGGTDDASKDPIERFVKSRWEPILASARAQYLLIPGHELLGAEISIGFLNQEKCLHIITRVIVPEEDGEIEKFYKPSSEQVELLFSSCSGSVGVVGISEVAGTKIGICFWCGRMSVDHNVSRLLLLESFPDIEIKE